MKAREKLKDILCYETLKTATFNYQSLHAVVLDAQGLPALMTIPAGCVPRAVTGISGCHLVDAGRRNLLSPWTCCFHQGGALSSSHQTVANAAQSPSRVFFPSFALISWHY